MREISFDGFAPEKQQIIDFDMDNKDGAVTGDLLFNSISFIATVPKDSEDASLFFKNLLVIKSNISVIVASLPAPPAPPVVPSKIIKETVEIKVNFEDLILDLVNVELLTGKSKNT